MANLDNFTNIYADLAQSSYNNRKDSDGNIYNFANGLTDGQKNKLGSNQSVSFDFPGAKDAHGNDASKVYLQPDNELRTVEEKKLFCTTSYEKGVLTDEKAGFNAYYVTDTSTLNKETKSTYFVTRGSDGASLDTLNDWLGNNYQFAINKAYIPQAKLAT